MFVQNALVWRGRREISTILQTIQSPHTGICIHDLCAVLMRSRLGSKSTSAVQTEPWRGTENIYFLTLRSKLPTSGVRFTPL